MDDILMRNYENPLVMRIVEGGSTMMLCGWMYGGGGLSSPLSFVYLLHWASSLWNHVFPRQRNFVLDMNMIDMVIMERFCYVTGARIIYTLYLLLLLCRSNEWHPFVCFGKTVMAAAWAYMYYAPAPNPAYVVSLALAALFYLFSDWALCSGRLTLKTMSHTAFHMCISFNAYQESLLYRDMHAEIFDSTRVPVHVLYIGLVCCHYFNG